MQLTVKQITGALKDGERKLPAAVEAVRANIKNALKQVEKRSQLDQSIDGDMLRLSEAAERRDQSKVDQVLAGITKKRSDREQLTAAIEAATESSATLLEPITPAINSAICLGPLVEVLSDIWFTLESDVQKRIMRATDRHIVW